MVASIGLLATIVACAITTPPPSKAAGNLAVILVVDESVSMRRSWEAVRTELTSLVDALEPGDFFSVIVFGKTASVEVERMITSRSSAEAIARRLANVKCNLKASRLDRAIAEVAGVLKRMPPVRWGRVALVVVTDAIPTKASGRVYEAEWGARKQRARELAAVAKGFPIRALIIGATKAGKNAPRDLQRLRDVLQREGQIPTTLLPLADHPSVRELEKLRATLKAVTAPEELVQKSSESQKAPSDKRPNRLLTVGKLLPVIAGILVVGVLLLAVAKGRRKSDQPGIEEHVAAPQSIRLQIVREDGERMFEDVFELCGPGRAVLVPITGIEPTEVSVEELRRKFDEGFEGIAIISSSEGFRVVVPPLCPVALMAFIEELPGELVEDQSLWSQDGEVVEFDGRIVLRLGDEITLIAEVFEGGASNDGEEVVGGE